MNSIDKLSEIFGKFPGIGPRQARRFVYFLLSRTGNYTSELVQAVQDIKKEIIQCTECMRFFAKEALGHSVSKCGICTDETRDASMLMIEPRDIDMQAVEKSSSYNGFYFVLGGVVPILEKEPEKRIRIKELESRLRREATGGQARIKEIILGMNANIEGENTAEYLRQHIGPTYVISTLGRGLSTGAELEYADPETLKNAFLHRTN